MKAAHTTRLRVLAGLLLAALALAWWFNRSRQATPAVVADGAPPVAAAPRSVAVTGSRRTPTIDFVDGVPVRPAGSAPVDAAGMLPHPITAEHARIFRENNLIASLDGAMDVRDAAGMRRLLQQYRAEYPEDAHVLQDAYELIADCLEHPSPELSARARRFYDERVDSGLRRYIRRYCLE